MLHSKQKFQELVKQMKVLQEKEKDKKNNIKILIFNHILFIAYIN